ncbi:MAG: hypothetical protein WA786_00505 [Acidimicrobiales bacterium]
MRTTTTTLEVTPTTITTTGATTPTPAKRPNRPATSVTKYVNATKPIAATRVIKTATVVSSGELSGTLSPGFSVADVPLQGPGLWVLETSAAIGAHLQCASRTASVNSRVVIMTNQGCQLQIASTDRGVSLTWQLTPVK